LPHPFRRAFQHLAARFASAGLRSAMGAALVATAMTYATPSAAETQAASSAPIETTETPAPLFTAQDLLLSGPAGPIGATLLLPSATRAALLLLPGSGPIDRNGNAPGATAPNHYALLAEALATQGVATLRADKRGIGQSGGDANAVTLDAYGADAAVLAGELRDRSALPCIWLAGHSEGALVALRAASDLGAVCGVILLAGPGRRPGEVLRSQISANPANAALIPDANLMIDRLSLGQTVPLKEIPEALRGLFPPAVQDYLINLFSQDPIALAAQVDLPALVIQGEADIQLSARDAEALTTALPQGVMALFPTMTHVLKDAADDSRAAGLDTYTNPDLPLAAGLADFMAAFIVTGGEP